ncbi:MAG: hypothetical protein ABI640_21940 [Gammaproteobacteria bacterium]
MATKNRFDLDAREAAVTKQLAAIHEQKSALLVQLGEGHDVSVELTAVNGEIAQHEATIATYAQARAARQQANSHAARTQRHASAVASADEAQAAAKQLGELAQGAVALVAQLGAKLDAIEQQKVVLTSHLCATSEQGRQNTNTRIYTNSMEQMQTLVRHLTLPGHLAAALFDSGLGRKGVPLPTVEVQRVGKRDDGKAPLAPAVQIANVLAKLGALTATITSWSKPTKEVA